MYRAQALYQFDGAVPTDLPLKEGEIVTIIGKLPGNLWWEGESADGRMVELPPEEDFKDFVGKTGISNFDIIQFVTNAQDNAKEKLSILCHVISGDGEYITEIFHEDFINLDLLIKERFPLLDLPPLPTSEMAHDIYKKLIHEYFMYYCIHQMVTPVILKWFQSIPKICVSPCPHWNVSIQTSNLIPEEEMEIGGKPLISVTRGEHYILHDIEDDYLQLEGEGKEGWCSLRYCEINWNDNYSDAISSQLKRIIPFSLPSIQCSDDLRINHITMQSLRMGDRFGPQPVVGDTVMLRIQVYIWNSLRGYMYQFFNTGRSPLVHKIGQADNSTITELIDHKIQLMHEGEKTMIILHSSTDAPKEVSSFLEGCLSFYLCYVIDLRTIQKEGEELIIQKMIDNAKKEKPAKPAKPAHLVRELACSADSLPPQPLVQTNISPIPEVLDDTPVVSPVVSPTPDIVSSPVDGSSKPPLPPKPKMRQTTKSNRPELPPKPIHGVKSSNSYGVVNSSQNSHVDSGGCTSSSTNIPSGGTSSLAPPRKPPKPLRLARPAKPAKPAKLRVSSSDSQEGIIASSCESNTLVQTPKLSQ